jgi:pilus assembly protein FimV
VRDIIVKAGLAALLIALAPGLASAAGLGRLTVLSPLGHPLHAEIELVSVTKAEMGSLSARVAPPEAYQRANLQYNSALPGARVTIEKRPDGRAYLKITTSRPVTEPFIDLMIDLTWSAGRILREYTALLDPPGVGSMPLGQAAPMVSGTPEMRPAPMTPEAPAAPLAPAPPPVQAAPEPPVSAPASEPIAPPPVAEAPAPTPTPTPAPAPAAAGPGQYGPIQRGETLSGIAMSVKPAGVTLEQMLVALYRANEDAFIRKNMNLVLAGKILRVPDQAEVESVSSGEAVTVYRTHVTDWRAYLQRLADAADKTPAGGRSAARGKIVAKVEEDSAAGSKDVVRISKGEPPAVGDGKATPRNQAERIRSLEEEVVAREKALAEANDRIVQLEKTIKDMQKLIELKSPEKAAAQQQAQPAPPPAAAPEPARPAPAQPTQPEAAKPAPAKPPVVAQPQPPAPKPKPKPKVVTPPPSEPGVVDQVMETLRDPMYLAAGGGVLVLGGLGLWMARRRRAREAFDADLSREAPTMTSAAAVAAGVAAPTDDMYSAATAASTDSAGSTDDVDPLAEAEVYIAYGRDGQAEEILKEALARAPNRADVKMKLLEIYAARKDKSAFGRLAADVQRQIGSSGGEWLKVAAMGYAFDSGNKLYEAGKGSAAPAPSGPRTGQNIDFDLGIGGTSQLTTTDIQLDDEAAAAVQAATQTVVDTGMATDVERAQRAAAAPLMPDFTLDVPPAGEPPSTDTRREAGAAERDINTIDFKIDLPPAATPVHELPTVKEITSPGGVDFKLEIPEGGLNVGDSLTTAPVQGVPTTKNGHWYDVQTKFDLAKAYQEMGDRSGAKEILEEVINEGDADQKAQAKALLDSLG